MKDIHHEFVELESNDSFQRLAKAFQGSLSADKITFNNCVVNGVLIKRAPEPGIWVRKWKLTVFEQITLQRHTPPANDETKYSIIYFVQPELFNVKNGKKKLAISSQMNSLFAANRLPMEFSVLPKQPFYVIDVTFTKSWIDKQFEKSSVHGWEKILERLALSEQQVLFESCSVDEYCLLSELDQFTDEQWQIDFLLKSRIYQLVATHLHNALKVAVIRPRNHDVLYHYDQIVKSEQLIVENLKDPLTAPEIARKTNLSLSSLNREFKMMYGKSIQKYISAKRMQFAQSMLETGRWTVQQVARELGYKQVSAFIQTFNKQYQYKPGDILKDRR